MSQNENLVQHNADTVAMTTDSVRLYSESLRSKWGFGDGDILDDVLEDAGYFDRYKTDIGFDHRVLCRVVREHLLPAIEQHHQVEVMEIGTIHNPIRASVIDGEEIDTYAESGPDLTPEFVDVPVAAILAIAASEAEHNDGGGRTVNAESVRADPPAYMVEDFESNVAAMLREKQTFAELIDAHNQLLDLNDEKTAEIKRLRDEIIRHGWTLDCSRCAALIASARFEKYLQGDGDGWLDDLADQGYTDEQIQGIRQWAQTQEDDRLLALAGALEEAGWTVVPPPVSTAPMADDDRIPSEVLRSLPEKFWDVAGWNNQGWSPVSVDPADRKRIVNGVLEVLDAMALAAVKSEHIDGGEGGQ